MVLMLTAFLACTLIAPCRIILVVFGVYYFHMVLVLLALLGDPMYLLSPFGVDGVLFAYLCGGLAYAAVRAVVRQAFGDVYWREYAILYLIIDKWCMGPRLVAMTLSVGVVLHHFWRGCLMMIAGFGCPVLLSVLMRLAVCVRN
jgi:hypothetical protein